MHFLRELWNSNQITENICSTKKFVKLNGIHIDSNQWTSNILIQGFIKSAKLWLIEVAYEFLRWLLNMINTKLFNQIIFFQFSGSVLDNGNSYTSGRHASLLSAPSSSRSMQESTQLREGLLTGTLTGQKVNYLDSGYSEEDPTEQQVTSCLMKTSSGSIYIPPHNMPKNPTMDSRQEYRFGHSTSSPSHSPTKESLKNSER